MAVSKSYFTLAAAMAILSTQAVAQQVLFEGVQNNALSRLLSVKASVPTLGACRKDQSRCFRMFVELTPRDPQELGVSAINSGGGPYIAYSAGGAQCRGYVTGGIGGGGYDRVRNKWKLENLTFVEQSKPGVAILEFGCDNDLIAGEDITIQTNFDVYVNARENGEVRYVFSRVKLVQR